MSTNNETIINEVLTYISHYIHNSTVNNIIKIAINFYNNEEILEAKKLLWNIDDLNLGNFIERRDSDKRSCSEANINDILDALIKLDSEQNLPNFVAKNIDKLPDRQPEELNLLFLINRIATMEKTLKNHSENLSLFGIELMEVKDKQNKLNKDQNQFILIKINLLWKISIMKRLCTIQIILKK